MVQATDAKWYGSTYVKGTPRVWDSWKKDIFKNLLTGCVVIARIAIFRKSSGNSSSLFSG